jgi:hypothetical protein
MGPFKLISNSFHEQEWAYSWPLAAFLLKKVPIQAYRQFFSSAAMGPHKYFSIHYIWAYQFSMHYLPPMGPHGFLVKLGTLSHGLY